MFFNPSLLSKPSRRQLGAAVASLAIAWACAFTLVEPARAASAAWTPAKTLASGLDNAIDLRTAVNASGRAVVVWDKLVGVDPGHPSGIFQTYAAVRAVAGGAWSKAIALSGPDASNGGAAVSDGNGQVAVFWNEGGVAYWGRSSDAGKTWSKAPIPAGSGFQLITGNTTYIGPTSGIDGQDRLTVILRKPNAAGGDDLQAISRGPSGGWSKPALLTGQSPAKLFGGVKLRVREGGSAFLHYGFSTFYRTAAGKWRPQQVINLAGMGQVFSASADMDAGGKAYFVLHSHFGGAFLYTSTAGAAWSSPVPVPAFSMLNAMSVVGSSADHALVYGIDANSGSVQAAATANGGGKWRPLADFGFGDSPQAQGSDNGLFALGWGSAGPSSDSYRVATGSFLGAAPYAQKTLSSGLPMGFVSIHRIPGTATAQISAGWVKMPPAGAGLEVAATSANARR